MFTILINTVLKTATVILKQRKFVYIGLLLIGVAGVVFFIRYKYQQALREEIESYVVEVERLTELNLALKNYNDTLVRYNNKIIEDNNKLHNQLQEINNTHSQFKIELDQLDSKPEFKISEQHQYLNDEVSRRLTEERLKVLWKSYQYNTYQKD